MTGPEGNSAFCFLRISNELFPKEAQKEKRVTATKRKTCNGNSNGSLRSTFVGNSALLPSDVIDFALFPAQRLLAGNRFIVRCHMTSK